MTKKPPVHNLDTRIFTEAIPWVQKFKDKIVVIKYGGNAMLNSELQASFASDIVWLHSCGIHPVVVHGGGPQITSFLDKMGIETEFIGGLRVTTPEAMELVRMVTFGKVGRELVGLINSYGPYAVGITGEDANTLTVKRRVGKNAAGEAVDIGLVGDVDHVETSLILDLVNAGKIPVISTIGPDTDGIAHNINADVAAGAIAKALTAEKLVMLTDVQGLYRNWPDTDSLISKITTKSLRTLLPSLESGMIPKVEACLAAVEGGVPEAHIVDGREPHSILTEIFTDDGIGTMVTP